MLSVNVSSLAIPSVRILNAVILNVVASLKPYFANLIKLFLSSLVLWQNKLECLSLTSFFQRMYSHILD
jgi:hypothetical protein